MQIEAATLLVGAVTLILLPLLAFLGSRQLSRVDKDIADGRASAEKALKETEASLMLRADEGHALAVRALDKLNEHKTHVAETYTSLQRFEGFESALFKKLDSIESKLDGKADKP